MSKKVCVHLLVKTEHALIDIVIDIDIINYDYRHSRTSEYRNVLEYTKSSRYSEVPGSRRLDLLYL